MKSICQLISVTIGLVAAVFMVLGLIIALIQWPVLVLCVIGVIFGVFPERKTGLTINLVVGAVAVLRLMLGGGVL